MKNWTETKQERRERKARENAGLSTFTTPTPNVETTSTPKRYVACLKWGNKYDHEYVNRLYNMASKNLTIPFEFVCFTENPSGINKNIRIEPLPKLSATGWWYKPYFVGGELPFKGTVLFLDLDVIVFRNIDNLFGYKPGKFCIIRDFNRCMRPTWDRMNSSVFRVEVGMFDQQWQMFKNNVKSETARHRGDQDWMYKHLKGHEFWPDEWIQSYKWEMRDRHQLKLINGKRNFVDVATPTVKDQTSIAVFHGDPNPADCKDPWVQKYWT